MAIENDNDTLEKDNIVENDAGKLDDPQEVKDSTEATDTPSDPEGGDTLADSIIEIKGKKFTASEIWKLQENYGNDSKWIQKNQERARQLNELERELAPLRALKPIIEQRPEILQQILTPTPPRNFDAELKELYTQKPDPYDVEATARWEYAKDKLIAESIAQSSMAAIEQKRSIAEAQQHNYEVENKGKADYLDKGKVNDVEFAQMTNWIVNNIYAPNNKYPKNAYEIAFKTLYEDRWLQNIKVETNKKTISSLLKTKSGSSDSGVRTSKTDDEELTANEQKLIQHLRAKSLH